MNEHLTTEERFWAKVDQRGADECWLWLGACHPNGYGAASIGHGKTGSASRVAWSLANEREIPPGMWVLHRCDNPPCCNPAHLFLGTRQDNVDDMMAKGRHWAQRGLNPIPRGGNHTSAKLTQEQVDEIRRRAKTERQSEILKDFPMIGNSQISNIVRGACW